MPLLVVVDIEKRMVLQHPNLGVHTKNSKHATTFLLDIPELLEVVMRWDQYVRLRIPDRGYWFAPLHPRTGDIDETNIEGNQKMTHLARHDLRIWYEENNIQYRNPHAFQHGHIHYGLKHAKNMEDYKAISLNVMHVNMEITDQIYSKLNPDEFKKKIDQLGKSTQDLGLSDLEKLRKIQEILGL